MRRPAGPRMATAGFLPMPGTAELPGVSTNRMRRTTAISPTTMKGWATRRCARRDSTTVYTISTRINTSRTRSSRIGAPAEIGQRTHRGNQRSRLSGERRPARSRRSPTAAVIQSCTCSRTQIERVATGAPCRPDEPPTDGLSVDSGSPAAGSARSSPREAGTPVIVPPRRCLSPHLITSPPTRACHIVGAPDQARSSCRRPGRSSGARQHRRVPRPTATSRPGHAAPAGRPAPGHVDRWHHAE